MVPLVICFFIALGRISRAGDPGEEKPGEGQVPGHRCGSRTIEEQNIKANGSWVIDTSSLFQVEKPAAFTRGLSSFSISPPLISRSLSPLQSSFGLVGNQFDKGQATG